MSNSIVIKEPKRAVDKPKSSQTSGLSSIEKTLYDNNQLMKKNVDAMQKMANSMVESQKTTKSIDKELSNLKEAIKTSSKFKLNNVIVDTIEIETAFIDDIQFTLEN